MLNVQSSCGGESGPEYTGSPIIKQKEKWGRPVWSIGAPAIGIRVVTARLYLAEGKCLFKLSREKVASLGIRASL